MSNLPTAQLDLTGSKPDSNSLEDANCPWHSPASPVKTCLLDHLRGAFLCFVCRSTGSVKVSVDPASSKRIAILTLEGVRNS